MIGVKKPQKANQEKSNHVFHNKTDYYQHSGFTFNLEEKSTIVVTAILEGKRLIQNKIVEQNLEGSNSQLAHVFLCIIIL